MSGNAIRTGIDSAGGTIQPGGGNTKVFIKGALVGVVGDPVESHGRSPHNSAVMVGGSSKVFINGIPVLRGGVDEASCGHVSESGSHVTIGG